MLKHISKHRGYSFYIGLDKDLKFFHCMKSTFKKILSFLPVFLIDKCIVFMTGIHFRM